MIRAEIARKEFKRTMPTKEPKPPKGPRQRKCSNCGASFVQQRMGQQVCGPDCAQSFARRIGEQQKRKAERAERVERKARLNQMKSIPALKAEAQVIFNRAMRLRDELAGHGCICCGRKYENDTLHGHSWDCGHYRSTGSADHLRYNENNAHRQLVVCNRHGAGRAVDYRIGLIARIGLPAVEALEADNTVIKWTREMLEEIKVKYRAMYKQLKQGA